MIYKIERLQLSSKVVGDDCWQEKNSKGFKRRLRNCPFNLLVIRRLQKEAKELSIQLVGDKRTNHLEERGNDTIHARSNWDFDVKCATIQFYGKDVNSWKAK
jgi:hypothetical protein